MNHINLHPFQHILREFDCAPQVAATGFRVDIEEDDKQYRLYADLPGADKKQISINVENNILSVRAQIAERQNKNTVRVERAHGEFARSFRLPQKVDADNIAATLKNGVLTLEIPKAKDAAGRKIEIN